MATYKVPQDVEAEDKLVFGLTFKQFIFAIVFFVSGFIGFQIAQASIILLGPILPVFLLSGILAFYRPKDQSAETKLLAYVNYWFKPRRRIWSRDGIREHVRIMTPKRQAPARVRSREEVRSQLKTLAQIVDTRGWAVKHVDVQVPTAGAAMISHEDRLIVPKDVQVTGTPFESEVAADILAEGANPLGQALEQRAVEAKEREIDFAREKMEQAKRRVAAKDAAGQEEPVIENVHAFGESTGDRKPDSSTPVTPHFQPFPAMNQTVVKPGQAAQLAADMSDQPISAVAERAKQLSEEDGVEFTVKH